MISFNENINLLLSAKLSPSSVREIIQSVYTNKITRIFLNDKQLALVAPILDALSLEFYLSPQKYLFDYDSGKGGFSNGVSELLPDTAPVGAFMVHLGLDKQRVLGARTADLSGNDQAFGNALGIPDCCVSYFLNYRNDASQIQNDFTLYSCHQQTATSELDPWVIHCAQYFGYGLISHFPCSMNCKKTVDMAKANAKLLLSKMPDLAATFIAYQGYCYLYTEYDGIYAFTEQVINDKNIWHYNNKQLEMSHSGLLAEALMKGDSIKIKTRSDFTVYAGNNEVMHVDSNKVYLLMHDKVINSF